jgi:hypothetical protein
VRALIREINTFLGMEPRRRRPRGASPAGPCGGGASRCGGEGAIAGAVGHSNGPSISSPPIRRDSEP